MHRIARVITIALMLWGSFARRGESQATIVVTDKVPVPPVESPEPADVAVVCPPVFLPQLKPWIEHRRQQGYRMISIDSRYPAAQIRRSIQELARTRGIRFVVLVGDADPEMSTDRFVRERCVPTFYTEAKVVTKWGSEPLIPSDNPYGDIDDDHVPELAVGRISVDSPDELQLVVSRILSYERRPSAGMWRRRVHFIAGVGGFGPIADTLIEGATKKFITEELPAGYEATMTYASWRSPYCPDPRRFRQTLLRRVDDGCLCWVYMGHGRHDRLDRIEAGEWVLPILEPGDVPRIRSREGSPVAILLACYTGAFEQPRECLAEELFRQPTGPIAVICGSRVTMPYALAVLGCGLMDGMFARHLPTVGEVLLHAKREMIHPQKGGSLNRGLIDGLAKTVSPSRDDLEGERREHLWLMNLLGDPLLRLPHSADLPLVTRQCVVPGTELTIGGTSPISGECTVELVCRRDGLTFVPPKRSVPEPTEEAFAELDATYWRANDQRYASRSIHVAPGPFQIKLPVPEQASGSCHLRAYVEGIGESALGSADILIQSPPGSAGTLKSNVQR